MYHGNVVSNMLSFQLYLIEVAQSKWQTQTRINYTASMRAEARDSTITPFYYIRLRVFITLWQFLVYVRIREVK